MKENDVTPTKPSSKAVVIRMSDLKIAASADKPRNAFGQYNKNSNVKILSEQNTPERHNKRVRGNRASVQNDLYCNPMSGIIMSEQKEDVKKMLESQDVFNMRNSKIMNSGSKNSAYDSRPSSLQKKRQQRKMWQKKN